MAVRTLLVLVVFTALYGCGQASTPPSESEKQGGIEKADKAPPTSVQQEEEPSAPVAKECSDFYGPQDAQAYLDTKATAADKENLNPDGEEWACNEGGVTFKPEPEITLATIGELSDRESGSLLQCQFIKYAGDHGQAAANKYVDDKFTEELGGGQITNANVEVTSIQEHFIQDGYSCTYDEIIATMNQQAASASAASGSP